MSLSTSKSKTQLAYASTFINLTNLGNGKAVNKPKGKNTSTVENTELAKGRHPARNSTGNIYDSIMGQIEPKQQDYIKSLIVKNERQSIKHEKESEKQSVKNNINTQLKKTAHNTVVSSKLNKQAQHSKKLSSSIGSHERTRSQAQLIVKDATLSSKIQTTKSIVHSPPSQKQNTQVSCNDNEMEENSKYEQSLKQVNSSSKEMLFKVSQQASGQYSLEKAQKLTGNNNNSTSNGKNPIIEALNNTSSSFAKKLQAFELQYPNEQRQQRSTHKKVGSKLAGEYYSCQASPKNGNKNIYTKQVVITTKPNNNYITSTKNEPISANISPISSTKHSNQKNYKKQLQSQPTIATNFISCLDEYLQALTCNTTQFHQQNTRTSTNNNVNMKRSSSSKFKQFSTSKGHPFTLGKQDEQEETIVLQNGIFNSKTTTKMDNNSKPLSFNQQQRLIKELSMQRKKVSELNSIIELFHQQLSKYKKKQKKMKQNQYHMIEVMKELNQHLTQEKNQRKRLQGVVKEFESKIRGISRGKEKKRRQSIQDEQRPQRKTIYGASSTTNNIHYNHNHSNSIKLQKHSKKPSNNRFSSMINNQQHFQDNGNNYDTYYHENKHPVQQGFFKNKTQKFSKIISNFQLENQPCDQDEEMYFRSKNYNNNNSKMMRDSVKNVGYQQQPNSCKNSSYLNSSLPNKSRPMTPKLVQDLFRSTKQSLKIPQNQQYNYDSQSSDEDLSAEYSHGQHYDNQGNMNQQSFESQSEFKPTQMSEDEYIPNDREHYHEMIKRMR